MKILLAIDSFKSSMSAHEIVDVIEENAKEHTFIKKTLADGGEGSLDILQTTLDLEKIPLTTLDTYQRKIETYYLFDFEAKEAYIETAMICGLEALDPQDLDVMESSSLGVGLAIKDAQKRGAQNINLFLGGTASNDGGLGLLKGLGYQLLGAKGQVLQGKTKDLGKLLGIIKPDKELSQVKLTLISDVINPLIGTDGATHVFGHQKGASPKDILTIEKAMVHYQEVLSTYFYSDFSKETSSGAAGGIPFALMNLFDFRVKSGIDFFWNLLELEDALASVDLVLTGEGKIDHQSFQGKTISRVIEKAREQNKKYFLICGLSDIPIKKLEEDPLFQGILELRKHASSLEESMSDAKNILAKTISKALADL